MNTIAIKTASTVTPFAQNLQMQQPNQHTAKEAVAANVQALIEQLEQGHSDGLTAYLTAMGRFHNYSLATSLRLHGRSPTQPALLDSTHGTSLVGKSGKESAAFASLPL